MEKKTNYSIVWYECRENSTLADRFYVPGFVGYLPFFVSGTDHERLENKEEIELREEHLLKGILYGINEEEKKGVFWDAERGKETYRYLLEKLGKGFGFDSLENLILSVAASARSKNGHAVSYSMLLTGNELLPDSSQIKSDLISDIWMILSEANNRDFYEEGLRKIVDLIYQVKMEDVIPGAREMIAYFGFTALMLLGMEEQVKEYLHQFIYPYVENVQLKIRIKDMLENPKSAKIESFG
ncbi:MAG: hypothetical protein ACYDH1_14555 [Anaerolineaceae bacterium]